VILAVLGLVFGAWNYPALDIYLTEVGPGALLAASFPVIGALIATHRPRNPLGWVFCTVGLSQGLVTFAYEYGQYGLGTAPGSVPGAALAIWVAEWAWTPGAGLLITLVLLLFPDGRLPSRAWLPVAWMSVLLILLIAGLGAVSLWPERGAALLSGSDEELFGEGPAVVVSVAFWLLLVCGFACLVALLRRFGRSVGVQRQQLKWFVYAGVLTVTVFAATQVGGSELQDLALLVSLPLVPSIPVAAGIAILRHRLYDIDRIINRTLVYVLLTAVLAVGYAAVVLTLGQLSGGVAAEAPSWAVAGATLAVAALFQPARRRIQAAVDRRFNRSRYDAARTIEAFSTRLRDELDLETLSTELLAVVEETMQPAGVSLWLRGTAPGARRAGHTSA
jgi:hypothetical protein